MEGNSFVFFHPQSEVMSEQIGNNTKIWQYVIVLQGARIGKNCNINSHCFIENDVVIGNNVTIKCGVYLWDGITLEDDVFIGPNVTFTNDIHPRSKKHPQELKKTVVCNNASIGANSTILPGLIIGAYAMIGAGSLVTKDVPENTLWYGSPAIFQAYICKCGQKLSNEMICPICKINYKRKIKE